MRRALVLVLVCGVGCFEDPPEDAGTSGGTGGTSGTGGTTDDPGSTSTSGTTGSGTTAGPGSTGLGSGSTGGETGGTGVSGSTSSATATDGGSCTILTFGENDDDDIKGVTADTWFDEEFPTDINGDDDEIRADGPSANGLVEHALLRFNLTGLPAGQVTDAVLRISTNGDNGSESSPGSQFSLYVVNEPWAENEATWVDASTGVPWSVPGCSAAPCIGAELLFFEPTEQNHTYELPLDHALVQSWRDDAPGNAGLLMATPADNGAQFHSSESMETTMRPSLLVEVCR